MFAEQIGATFLPPASATTQFLQVGARGWSTQNL
jgi:hypothetical protein